MGILLEDTLSKLNNLKYFLNFFLDITKILPKKNKNPKDDVHLDS